MSRHYEVMVILDPTLDERTVNATLEPFLKIVSNANGSVEKVDIWGRRRLAFEIKKNSEGIYALLNLITDSDTVKELDRQLSLQEIVLRTKVVRRDDARRRSTKLAARI